MATLCMSSSSSVKFHQISPFIHSSFPANPNLLLSLPSRRSFFHTVNYVPESLKLRARVSLFPFFFTKSEDTESLKQEHLEAIAPLDQKLIDQIASKLEAANKVKEPLKSSLLNGKWELLYTTSQSILQTKFIIIAEAQILERQWKNLPGYQCRYIEGSEYRNMTIFQSAIVLVRLRNLVKLDLFAIPGLNSFSMSTCAAPQATANLVPLNARRVAVKFDSFKIASLIPIKNRGSGRGELEITYLDEELRISRGNQGNLFILRMVDPSYRVPL